MLKLILSNGAVVEVQPTASLLLALIAVDVDEFAAQLGVLSRSALERAMASGANWIAPSPLWN